MRFIMRIMALNAVTLMALSGCAPAAPTASQDVNTLVQQGMQTAQAIIDRTGWRQCPDPSCDPRGRSEHVLICRHFTSVSHSSTRRALQKARKQMCCLPWPFKIRAILRTLSMHGSFSQAMPERAATTSPMGYGCFGQLIWTPWMRRWFRTYAPTLAEHRTSGGAFHAFPVPGASWTRRRENWHSRTARVPIPGPGTIRRNHAFIHAHVLLVRGLTTDDKYLVTVILRTDAPFVKDLVSQQPITSQDQASAHFSDVNQRLNAAQPGDFSPSLDTLDTLVQSLSVFVQ